MWVTCVYCKRGYDDAKCWTICPHGPLAFGIRDYCPSCDTVIPVHGKCRHQLALEQGATMDPLELLARTAKPLPPEPMTCEEYRELALRTEADQEKILFRLVAIGPQAMRLDNAARGLSGDCGEVASAVMKYIEYGKELDPVNMLEEVGDVLWRLNQLCAAMEALTGKPFNLNLAMEANIRKLAARYGEKFSDFAALNRNKEEELRALKNERYAKAYGAERKPGLPGNPKAKLDTAVGPKPEEWATAVAFADWCLNVRTDRIPPLALAFLEQVKLRTGEGPNVAHYAFAVYGEVVMELERGPNGYQPVLEERVWLIDQLLKEQAEFLKKKRDAALKPKCQYCESKPEKIVGWKKGAPGKPGPVFVPWCGKCSLKDALAARGMTAPVKEGEDYTVEPIPDGGADGDNAKLNPVNRRS